MRGERAAPGARKPLLPLHASRAAPAGAAVRGGRTRGWTGRRPAAARRPAPARPPGLQAPARRTEADAGHAPAAVLGGDRAGLRDSGAASRGPGPLRVRDEDPRPPPAAS